MTFCCCLFLLFAVIPRLTARGVVCCVVCYVCCHAWSVLICSTWSSVRYCVDFPFCCLSVLLKAARPLFCYPRRRLFLDLLPLTASCQLSRLLLCIASVQLSAAHRAAEAVCCCVCCSQDICLFSSDSEIVCVCCLACVCQRPVRV